MYPAPPLGVPLGLTAVGVLLGPAGPVTSAGGDDGAWIAGCGLSVPPEELSGSVGDGLGLGVCGFVSLIPCPALAVGVVSDPVGDGESGALVGATACVIGIPFGSVDTGTGVGAVGVNAEGAGVGVGAGAVVGSEASVNGCGVIGVSAGALGVNCGADGAGAGVGGAEATGGATVGSGANVNGCVVVGATVGALGVNDEPVVGANANGSGVAVGGGMTGDGLMVGAVDTSDGGAVGVGVGAGTGAGAGSDASASG